jgi:hypothetical protein
MNFVHGVIHFMLKKKRDPSPEPTIGSESDGVKV